MTNSQTVISFSVGRAIPGVFEPSEVFLLGTRINWWLINELKCKTGNGSHSIKKLKLDFLLSLAMLSFVPFLFSGCHRFPSGGIISSDLGIHSR